MMWLSTTTEHLEARDQLIEIVNVADPAHLKQSRQPKTLRRSTLDLLLLVWGDVFAILLWFAILVYASLLWYSHGKKEIDLSDGMFDPEELMGLARPLSTVFTILFAATTGRAIKSFALWLLQRGSTIATLDRLFGSTTVGGTLLTNSTLGIPRTPITYILITALLCLWTLSPLASQAILRVVSFQPDVSMRSLDRTYMNISDWQGLQGAGSDGSTMVVAPNTLMNAALIAPQSTKNMPRDLWGNVKIPLLSAVAGPERQEGWQDVKYDDFASYSSLIGLPIALPVDGAPRSSGSSANMSVESWYWDLDCSVQPWTNGSANASDYNATAKWRHDWIAQFTYNWTSTLYDMSPPIQIFVKELGLTRTGDFCNVECGNTTTVYCPGLPPRTLGIILNDSGYPVYGMCNIRTIYIDTEVLCDRNGCQASRIRPSTKKDLPPPEYTVLDHCMQTTENWHPLGRFFANLVDAIQSRSNGSGGKNALVGFILNPANAFGGGEMGYADHDRLYQQPSDIITQRLEQVLNSYWISGISFNLTTGDWGDNFQQFSRYTQGSLLDGTNTSLLDTSTATIYDEYSVFTCNLWWLTWFTISTLVALITSIMGLVVILLSKGPRLAMNMTTMTRDSPYVMLPHVPSYMSDDERCITLGQAQVILADVAPNEETGYVAIAQKNGAVEIAQLEKDRLYR